MSGPIDNIDDAKRVSPYYPISPQPPPLDDSKNKAIVTYQSSLTPSDQSYSTVAINASIPILITPVTSASQDNGVTSVQQSSSSNVGYAAFDSMLSAQFSMEIAAKQHQIVSNMLDSWANDLQKEAQRRIDELFSPSFRAWQELNTVSPTELTQPSPSLITSMAIGLTAGTIATGAAIGIASLPATASTVGASSFLSDWSVLVSIIPNGQRAEVGFVGALFTAFMINVSALENLANSEEAKPEDLAFAKLYATNLMSKLHQIDLLMQNALAGKLDQGAPITEQKVQELTAFLKSVLLCVALAQIYKAETGWITGQEFKDMLNGQMTIDDPIKQQLISMINTQLAILEPKQREKLLNTLGSYFDRIPKPTFEEMLDTNHVLGEVSDRSQTPQATIQHRQI